jgi:hypothetical protein
MRGANDGVERVVAEPLPLTRVAADRLADAETGVPAAFGDPIIAGRRPAPGPGERERGLQWDLTPEDGEVR